MSVKQPNPHLTYALTLDWILILSHRYITCTKKKLKSNKKLTHKQSVNLGVVSYMSQTLINEIFQNGTLHVLWDTRGNQRVLYKITKKKHRKERPNKNSTAHIG